MKIQIPFVKVQGCGNDFVVIKHSDFPKEYLDSKNKIIEICDRHYGVGSDGLMLVGDASNNPIEVSMYNPDGSEMGMCGNGIRCVVRYLCLSNEPDKNQFVFSVFGREILCRTEDQGLQVEVDLGCPEISPEPQIIQLSKNEVKGLVVFVGNPHFVSFVETFNPEYLNIVGPELELHSHFPDRTNVEFVRIINRNQIELRVWERGAGWTLACGSGACAAVIAGIKQGQIDSPCLVDLPGGRLIVKWDYPSNNASVFLSGPAKEIFFGTFLVDNS